MEPVVRFGVLIEDLEPVEETSSDRSIEIQGKVRAAVLYRRRGLSRYTDLDPKTGKPGKSRLADYATFLDTGGYGYAPTYTIHKDEPPTEAERAATRQNVQAVATQVMQSMGIW